MSLHEQLINAFRDKKTQSETVPKIFQNASDEEVTQLEPKIINRVLHILSTGDTTDLAIRVAKLVPDDMDNYPLMSLKVSIFAKTETTHPLAVDMVEKISGGTKRLYIPILQGYLKWRSEIAFKFLYGLRDMFPIEFEDIQPFVEDPERYNVDYESLFEILREHNIELRGKFGNHESVELDDDSILARVTLSSSQIANIRDLFEKRSFKKGKDNDAKETFEKFLDKKGNKYDMFVDGNNILHYCDRRVNFTGFKRVKNAYDHLVALGHTPLFIIHRRHRDNLGKLKQFVKVKRKIEKMLEDVEIYYTPYGMNDDIFFMWGGFITSGSYIVSNDKFRDHIFKVEKSKKQKSKQRQTQIDDKLHLKKYLDQTMVTYNFSTRTDITFNFPPKVSRCTQFCDGKWYVPTEDGKWFCL